MNEHEIEPIRGLPGLLPPGEHILWQGAPDPLALARSAFHARGVAIYFALLTGLALSIALVRGSGFTGTLLTGGLGVAGVALLLLLGWVTARTSVYTLTNRRFVLRIGVALPTCVNLPLTKIAAVDLSAGGDIVLRMSEAAPLGWVALWPHARPWRLSRPEPMLRVLPDADAVAALVVGACRAVQSSGEVIALPSAVSAPVRALSEAAAA